MAEGFFRCPDIDSLCVAGYNVRKVRNIRKIRNEGDECERNAERQIRRKREGRAEGPDHHSRGGKEDVRNRRGRHPDGPRRPEKGHSHPEGGQVLRHDGRCDAR